MYRNVFYTIRSHRLLGLGAIELVNFVFCVQKTLDGEKIFFMLRLNELDIADTLGPPFAPDSREHSKRASPRLQSIINRGCDHEIGRSIQQIFPL
jgi:hypothetical protein